jgi:hypothetical protein
MPTLRLADRSPPGPTDIPDAATIAVAIVIADIVHELRRASIKPIWRNHYGMTAAAHAGAVAFGWLAPDRTPNLLALTDAGRAALAASGRS